jgi:hypothetical protein
MFLNDTLHYLPPFNHHCVVMNSEHVCVLEMIALLICIATLVNQAMTTEPELMQ